MRAAPGGGCNLCCSREPTTGQPFRPRFDRLTVLRELEGQPMGLYLDGRPQQPRRVGSSAVAAWYQPARSYVCGLQDCPVVGHRPLAVILCKEASETLR
jgi:hypothetical protein